MRGSLTPLGPNHWRMRVHVGKGIRRSRNFRGGKRAADDALRKFVDEVQTGLDTSGQHATIATLIERWWAGAERRLSVSTQRSYRQYLVHYILPAFGEMKIAKLQPELLDRFYMSLDHLSPATIHQVHSILGAAFTQAVKWGWVSSSPVRRATPPPIKRTPGPGMPVEDVRRLLREADDQLATAIALAALTGARRGELCRLRWSDLDGVTLRINGTKTAQVRAIHVDDIALQVLAARRQLQLELARAVDVPLDVDPFILSGVARGNQPWSPDGLSAAFYKLKTTLGMPWRFHDLRHFAATQLIGAGVDIRTVAGRLGHSDATTTLRVYSHVIAERDRSAAAILGSLIAEVQVGPHLGSEGDAGRDAGRDSGVLKALSRGVGDDEGASEGTEGSEGATL